MSNMKDSLEIIPVTSADVPCVFSIKLSGKTFELTFRYNEAAAFFTVDLAIPGPRGEKLCQGVVLRMSTPLFEQFNDERYPWPVIVPMCLTGERYETITWDNFGQEVKLYLLPRE